MNSSISQKRIVQAIIICLMLVYLFIESERCGDFLIFLSASKDLFAGTNIYINTYFDGYHYFYSVFFAIVLYPLSFLNTHFSTFLWLLFNAFLLYRLYRIINSFLPTHELTAKQFRILWILTGIFSARLVFENLHVGQMTIFLLYLCMEGISRIRSGQKITGAFLIALGINIKLLPIVILPYLFYRKEFKASLFIILFYLLLLYLPVLFIGIGQNALLLKTWGALINPLNTNHILDVDERSFHGLSTLLSVLLVEHVPDTFALKIKRNILDISLQQLKYTLMIARLCLVTFTLYFMRTLPFKEPINTAYRYREMSYILLLIPLIFPHQQHYAFLFIIPAFAYCVFYMIRYYHAMSSLKRNSVIIMLSLIYIVVNLKLLLGEYNYYYEHFKILTYGALLLILVLGMLQPKRDPETA